MSNNLTGTTVSNTFGRLVQIVGGLYYDGLGNQLNIGSGSGTSGTSGIDGTSGTTPNITPLGIITISGTQNSVNKNFVLDTGINNGELHQFFISGQLMSYIDDYSISGTNSLIISSHRPAPTQYDNLKFYGGVASIGTSGSGTSGSGTSGSGTSGTSGIDGTSGVSPVITPIGAIGISGAQNGMNKNFVLNSEVNLSDLNQFFIGGQLMTEIDDYSISGTNSLTISSNRPAPTQYDTLRFYGGVASLSSNGSSGTSGSSGMTPAVLPLGAISISGIKDGVNKIFTLSEQVSGNTYLFFLSGQLMKEIDDYSIIGTNLIISDERVAPTPTDSMIFYGGIGVVNTGPSINKYRAIFTINSGLPSLNVKENNTQGGTTFIDNQDGVFDIPFTESVDAIITTTIGHNNILGSANSYVVNSYYDVNLGYLRFGIFENNILITSYLYEFQINILINFYI
jgi:hypothetical protein